MRERKEIERYGGKEIERKERERQRVNERKRERVCVYVCQLANSSFPCSQIYIVLYRSI